MLKHSITDDRLHALQRVEAWIARHPDSNAGEIGLALGIKRTTLNSYTRTLREMGRLTAASQARAGVHGTKPDTYRVVPGLAPLAPSSPIPALRKEPAIQAPEPAQRMDLVAALFGPARITS